MRQILLAILVIGLLSCNNDKQPPPSNLLKESKMVDVIVDIQLLEAVHKEIRLFGEEKLRMIDTSYMVVFNKHEVSVVEFDSSYSYYVRNPKLYEKLMEKVERRIQLEE